MRILVTGASGLIGKRLVRALLARDDTVLALSRSIIPDINDTKFESLIGDPTQPGSWLDVIATCDAIVHLAGEPVFAKRWSDAFIETIRASRTKSTKLIADALAANPRRADGSPRILVSGSAVGYYGADTGDRIITEADAPGSDPMATICRDWEDAASSAKAAGVRVCHPRTGIVLDPDGGALPRMTLPFRLFVGGRIASGKQYVSWIHRDDMTALLLFAIDTPALHGPFNATAPNPVTNREFSANLGRVLHRPNWLPVPRFALRLAVGRVVQVVAGGQRALPAMAERLGFRFRHPELEPALRELMSKES